jgi:hypothetical protein
MRLFKILDQTEQPTVTDIANNVPILNDLLRQEQADGAAQYLMNQIAVTLPPGVSGQFYTFMMGTASPSYLVQVDAVAVKQMWLNDINNTVNRETRAAPKADVVRTTYPGIITKWHQERQVDGSIRVYAWQPPRAPSKTLIEYGGRMPLISNPAGTDTVALPPEGIHDATLLLGRRIYSSYGVGLMPTDVIVQDSERVNARWRDWARGQQWLRLVRS